jgi:hypothetical protein
MFQRKSKTGLGQLSLLIRHSGHISLYLEHSVACHLSNCGLILLAEGASLMKNTKMQPQHQGDQQLQRQQNQQQRSRQEPKQEIQNTAVQEHEVPEARMTD